MNICASVTPSESLGAVDWSVLGTTFGTGVEMFLVHTRARLV